MNIEIPNPGSKTRYSWRKILKKALLSLVISLVCPIYGSLGTETVIVDEAFNKREIKVKIGSFIQVELKEFGTAGYSWKIQDLDGDYFKVVKEETVAPPQSEDVTGAPITRKWLIRTLKEGKSMVNILHYRSWENPESASDSYTLKIRIIP